MKNKPNWEVEFDEYFLDSEKLDEQTHYSYPCFMTAFQKECVKEFITNLLENDYMPKKHSKTA